MSKKYVVLNKTDGILASPAIMSKKQAEKFIKDFPKRFEFQGYYLTRDRQRIPAEDVVLTLDPV